mgnify:CR=1 FL=1
MRCTKTVQQSKASRGYHCKLIVLTLLTAVMVPAAHAIDSQNVWGASGTLHMQGSVITSACGLEMESTRQEIWLGETPTASFQRPGDQGVPVTFQLHLTDCQSTGSTSRDIISGAMDWSDVQPSVSAGFYAAHDADTPAYIQVTGIKGMALKLEDSRGKTVPIGIRSAPVLLSPGDNVLTYKLIPVRTEASLKAGSYSATVNFRLFYD